MRIISLLPSATEILFALGLGEDVVGVTFECDFPEAARSKRIVSTSALPEGLSPAEIDAVVKQRMTAGEDLYRLDRDAFADLQPDLVVTQDLCAVCAVDVGEVGDALAYLGCRADVLTLDPMTLDDVIASIERVGDATGTIERARAMAGDLRTRLAALARRLGDVAPRPTLLLEWTDPPFTAGHWVPDMIAAAGGEPLLAWPGENSRGVAWDAVAAAGAEVVLVSPCGYRLDGAAALARELVRMRLLPAGVEVWAVDADALVVRPGPRVVEGSEQFASILHERRTGPADPAAARRIH